MTPAQTAQQLIQGFDSISDYPVQCALLAVSEIIAAVHGTGNDACFWVAVKEKLEEV